MEEILPKALLILAAVIAAGALYLKWPSEAERAFAPPTTTTIASALSRREIEEHIRQAVAAWDRFDACPYFYSLREQGMRRQPAVHEVAAFITNGPPIPQVVAEVRQLVQEKC